MFAEVPPPEPWEAAALCRQVGHPDNWFPPAGHIGQMLGWEALDVCRRCPVRADCLEFALRTRQPQGIWGGLTHQQRSQLLRDGAA